MRTVNVALFTEEVQDIRTLTVGRKFNFFPLLFHVLARNKILIWHLEIRASLYILIIKANEMNYFSASFCKEFYMFRTDLLSIIRSLNTLFIATGICHTSYVDCLPARSGSNLTSLADSQHN
jgi:hypothetical protein